MDKEVQHTGEQAESQGSKRQVAAGTSGQVPHRAYGFSKVSPQEPQQDRQTHYTQTEPVIQNQVVRVGGVSLLFQLGGDVMGLELVEELVRADPEDRVVGKHS